MFKFSKSIHWLAAACITCSSLGWLASAHAQTAANFPNKPVKVLVGFTAGGGLDVLARIVAQRMTEQTGQSFVVENRAGAGSNVAGELVARSPADGYTLMHTHAGLMSINPALYKNMSFSPMKELTPLSHLVDLPFVVTVRADLPIKTLADLRNYARANPGKLNMGSGGNGGSPHLALELFKSQNNVFITHIPYRGSADAMRDMLGGSIDVMIDAIALSAPHIKSGKVRALAVTTDKRSPALPDVPTSTEAGFPQYKLAGWHGWVAPAATPPDIVAKLSNELQKALKDPATVKRIEDAGYFVVGTNAQDFASLLTREAPRFAELVRVSGAKLD
jgi:tripartite-type tricarboxylate transporter receptor subunit TctC